MWKYKLLKYVQVILGLLLPLSAMAEPSGRGADIADPTSLHQDVFALITGVVLLLIAGGCYLLKERHKAFEIMAAIFGILGGLAALGGGWSLLAKFVFFPIFYVLVYAIKALLYIAVILIPYLIIAAIAIKIPNIPLRIIFCVVIAALCIWGEYYCIVELGASEWFPKWNFANEFYLNLYPVEE